MDVNRDGRKKPSGFPQFRLLPPELRARIWEVACPGPRLIEVYPLPVYNSFSDIAGYEWRSHQCECEHRCMLPLVVGQVCIESRKIFKRDEGKYSRCFGTYVNWEKDTVYIGDRTGHLHNAHFLKTINLAGGLGQVKNLAVYEDTWTESRKRHGNQAQEFKKCGPVAVVQQLGVENLTIVGKAGFFADGMEFYNEVDERDWLWNSDSEGESLADEDRDDEDVTVRDGIDEELSADDDSSRGEEDPDGQDASFMTSAIILRGGFLPTEASIGDHGSTDSEAGQDLDDDIVRGEHTDLNDDMASLASSHDELDPMDFVDDWNCNVADDGDEDPRIYKPRWPDRKFCQHGIPNEDSGLALVDFASIPGKPLWMNKSKKFVGENAIKAEYIVDFEDAKIPHQQAYEEDNDPESTYFIDWASFTPPSLKLAFFRRTGQSCRVRDWKDLGKQYITWMDADKAKRRPALYIKQAIRKGWYKPNDIQLNDYEDAFGAVEGYGKVEDYVANGMKIPCTATTKSGKSYAKGNYMNTTRKVDFNESIFS